MIGRTWRSTQSESLLAGKALHSDRLVSEVALTKRERPDSLPVTRSLESTRAIGAATPAALGVPQWLRVYTAHAYGHFCSRGERLIPTHRHAFDSAISRSPPETCTACLSAFSPHSGGLTASDLCYADDWPPLCCLRDTVAAGRSGSPTISIAD